MKASELLPDHQQTLLVNGQPLRKGSVAAFLANATIIDEATDTNSETYTKATEDLLELAPVLEQLGLFKHMSLRSEKVKNLLIERIPALEGSIT